MILTFPCTNGETCYAAECSQARTCMHAEEARIPVDNGNCFCCGFPRNEDGSNACVCEGQCENFECLVHCSKHNHFPEETPH